MILRTVKIRVMRCFASKFAWTTRKTVAPPLPLNSLPKAPPLALKCQFPLLTVYFPSVALVLLLKEHFDHLCLPDVSI